MKKNHIVIMSLVLVALTWGSCKGLLMGDELGRLKVNTVSTSDDDLTIAIDTIELAQDEKVAIWSEMDVEYEGGIALQFNMQVMHKGELLGNFQVDPFEGNVTVNAVETSFGGSSKKSFTKKNTTFTAQQPGQYIFSAYLVSDGNPSLVLNKAEVLLTK